jgi:hypothetical protein
MTTPVDFSPTGLGFGGVLPGAIGPDITTFGGDLPSSAGGIKIAEAPIDANLTVSIIGDTSHFHIRDVFIMEWVEEVVRPDPGERPPHGHGDLLPSQLPKTKVLEVVSQTDGSSPVAVKKGHLVLVRVEYTALNVEGAFTGTLVIQGDTWDPVRVPLSLFLADVRTSVSDTINIAQGYQASLPLTVTSVMGPGIDVTYEMSRTQLHTGLTLLPNKIHLNPKETKTFSLMFQADSSAPLGVNDVAVDQLAFGRQGFFIKANIVATMSGTTGSWQYAPVGRLDLAATISVSDNVFLQLYGAYDSDGRFVDYRVRYLRIATDGTVDTDVMLSPLRVLT